jgi:hypothetical protein
MLLLLIVMPTSFHWALQKRSGLLLLSKCRPRALLSRASTSTLERLLLLLTKLIDPRSLNVNMLFLNYPFGTKPNPMRNEAMRAVLYYFYATKFTCRLGGGNGFSYRFVSLAGLGSCFRAAKAVSILGTKM